MSTILKALQRLEDEKSAKVERSLNEEVVAHRPPPDPERRGLRIGAVAIGGLAVAAAALLFWFTRGDPDAEVAMESPPPAAAPAPATEREVAAAKPRRRPSGRPAPAAARRDSPEVAVDPLVEVVKRLDATPADPAAPAAPRKRAAQQKRAASQKPAASQQRAESPAKAGAERPGRRPSARKTEPRVAREAAQPALAPTQVSPEAAQPALAPTQVSPQAAQPAPAPKQVADAEPPATPISVDSALAKSAPASTEPVETAAVAPKPAPSAVSASTPAAIREPERQVVQRAKLPALSVEKTIWHPDADRRVAVVKLTDAEEILRLKEGDAVGPLVVKAIKPGSVLFNHDGVEIRFNVGG